MEKRIRLTIDLSFQLGEITDDDVREELKSYSNYDETIKSPLTWEIATRQNRLLQALLEDEDVLNTILTKFAIERYLESSALGEVHSTFDVEAEDEQILEPIIARLDDDDRNFFREAIEERLFFENTAYLWSKLDPKEVELSIDVL